MATSTTNLGLIKPERSDNYSVDVMGTNMDIIDEKITALEAGEFESVNCAGTIKTNKIVLSDVGVTTDDTGVLLSSAPAATVDLKTSVVTLGTIPKIEPQNIGLIYVESFAKKVTVSCTFTYKHSATNAAQVHCYVYLNGVELAYITNSAINNANINKTVEFEIDTGVVNTLSCKNPSMAFGTCSMSAINLYASTN